MRGLVRWVLSLRRPRAPPALSMTSAFPSGVRALMAEVGLLADEGWIMGGTGNPIPDPDYLSSVESLYLSQYLPPSNDYSFQGLTTPEQFCPIICNASQPDLSFGDSVNAGRRRPEQRDRPGCCTAGNDVSVLGYSQSATVATV